MPPIMALPTPAVLILDRLNNKSHVQNMILCHYMQVYACIHLQCEYEYVNMCYIK